MHTVFALLCFVVVIHWLIFPYPSGLLHWHCGNLTIAPVPAKQPWWIWINTSCEFIMNDCITTTKQNTTKLCAYFLGYTVAKAEKSRRECTYFTRYIVRHSANILETIIAGLPYWRTFSVHTMRSPYIAVLFLQVTRENTHSWPVRARYVWFSWVWSVTDVLPS